MLALDIPVARMAWMLAPGPEGPWCAAAISQTPFVGVFALVCTALFITPTAVHSVLGRPAWKVNDLWPWVDHVRDAPLRAVSSVLLACTVLPTRVGVEGVRLVVLTRLVAVLLREITFEVYGTRRATRPATATPPGAARASPAGRSPPEPLEHAGGLPGARF